MTIERRCFFVDRADIHALPADLASHAQPMPPESSCLPLDN
jgi:hypothetical protein